MKLDFSDDPVEAFSQVRTFHWAVSAFLLVLVATGELVHATAHQPEGHLIDVGDADWFIRIGLLFYAGYTTFSLLLLYREKRMIESLMRLQPLEMDGAVTRALATSQVLRSVISFGVGVLAFSVFVLTADRITLYVGALLSLGLLVLMRPRRGRWEAVFREASLTYPGVSASPW